MSLCLSKRSKRPHFQLHIRSLSFRFETETTKLLKPFRRGQNVWRGVRWGNKKNLLERPSWLMPVPHYSLSSLFKRYCHFGRKTKNARRERCWKYLEPRSPRAKYAPLMRCHGLWWRLCPFATYHGLPGETWSVGMRSSVPRGRMGGPTASSHPVPLHDDGQVRQMSSFRCSTKKRVPSSPELTPKLRIPRSLLCGQSLPTAGPHLPTFVTDQRLKPSSSWIRSSIVSSTRTLLRVSECPAACDQCSIVHKNTWS